MLVYTACGCAVMVGGFSERPRAVTALPTPEQRQALQQLLEEDPAAMAHWQVLRQRADRWLNDDPSPLKVIHYRGVLSNDPLRRESVARLNDMRKIDDLGQAWVITKDARYALQAHRFIMAWVRTYQPNGDPINENKLEPLLANHVLLKEFASDAERAEVRAWVDDLAHRQQDSARVSASSRENNWHPKRLKLIAWAGIITGDQKWTDYALAETRGYIGRALRADGSSYDLEQRDSLGYHMGGVKPLIRLASILIDQDPDLYFREAPSGASVAASVEFMMPYALGEKTHREFINSKVDFDRRRAEAGLAEYQPGTPFNPLHSIRLFDAAMAFEPRYGELIATLTGQKNNRFPTWASVLAAVGWVTEDIGL